RVYFHKVLSSLSIANSFENIITQCTGFLAEESEITWSEPGYIFDDLLDAGGQLENIITPIFAKNNLQANLLNYEVSNRAENSGACLVEKWTLIKAIKG
ncbi:MAG: hypothetical protein MUF15_18885, partial [Acidobacteria bacterium]|nr:hypothetical protein [Acidobacteriota bacterium]